MGKKKNPEIRWLKRDQEKLKKAVKNTNAKAKRLKNKGIEVQTISIEEIKRDVRTRKELNKLLNDMEKFRKRGSEKKIEKNDVFPFEKTLAKLEHRTNEDRKAKKLAEIKELQMKSRGENLGYKREETGIKQMGDIRLQTLKPKKFDENLKRKEFNMFKKHMDYMLDSNAQLENNKRMKENYIRSMILHDYPEYLQQMIAFIGMEDFMEVQYSDVDSGFSFIYDETQRAEAEEYFKLVWNEKYEKNKYNYLSDLKNKGATPDMVSTLEKMDMEEFLSNVVSPVKSEIITDNGIDRVIDLKYTIYRNINQIKRNMEDF